MSEIKLTRKVKFLYECLPQSGTCRIAKDTLQLTLRLEGRTGAPPDVLEVESWLTDYLKQPLVVEELAIAACEKWGLKATAEGRTDSHGLLTAVCKPKR